MKLRPLFVVVTVVLTALTALFGVQSAASAASNSEPLAYPQAVCSSISVSTTNPALGEKILVEGQAFQPNTLVKLELSLRSGGPAVLVKSVLSDADGSFETTVQMPSSAAGSGKYKLVATSGYETAKPCPADPYVNLNVGLGGENHHRGSTGATTGGHGTDNAGAHNGGTAFTGVDILLLVLVAAALVAVGGETMRRSRRRSSTG